MYRKQINEIGMINGYVEILPTQDQFEDLKNMKETRQGSLTKKEVDEIFPDKSRIENKQLKSGKSYKTMKVKLNRKNQKTGEYENDGIINVKGEQNINKILMYKENKIPVKVICSIVEHNEKEYFNALSVEDNRSFEKMKELYSNKSKKEVTNEATGDGIKKEDPKQSKSQGMEL